MHPARLPPLNQSQSADVTFPDCPDPTNLTMAEASIWSSRASRTPGCPFHPCNIPPVSFMNALPVIDASSHPLSLSAIFMAEGLVATCSRIDGDATMELYAVASVLVTATPS